ncbi:hypothetical protein FNV43_RR19918 [Rhamnella rubrinervis]|uniref:Uncharacterized protein n=1 Tax=Rhamnella rubrinervis TaxID=2594499 RepID=A0A8K0DTX2_9ROSA|nr:hypothetical protein FNV43_RR19918 [Rhamnella rubrinervis]
METNPSGRGYFHVSRIREDRKKAWVSGTPNLKPGFVRLRARDIQVGGLMIQRRYLLRPSLQKGKDDSKAPTQIQSPSILLHRIQVVAIFVPDENPQQIPLYEVKCPDTRVPTRDSYSR